MFDAVELSHLLVAARLRPGGIAVDATAGNGHDTLFLARQVGPQGSVHAFDRQAEAIESTRRHLAASMEGTADVGLHLCGHEEAGRVLASLSVSGIHAAMFNLGYLPGGDKSVTTQPATTLEALSALARLLLPGGLISVVAYVGHPGGLDERDAVVAWARACPQPGWAAWHYSALNSEAARTAELVVLERPGPRPP
jgi:predicted methyltransferase